MSGSIQLNIPYPDDQERRRKTASVRTAAKWILCADKVMYKLYGKGSLADIESHRQTLPQWDISKTRFRTIVFGDKFIITIVTMS